MLVLGCVAARYVAKWRICSHQIEITKFLELYDVTREVWLQPFSSKSEGSEVFVDCSQKCFCLVISDCYIWFIKVLHVVAAIYILKNFTFTSRSESFNGILLSFYHFCFRATLYDRYTVSSVDLVSLHAVTTQILDCFDWVCLISNFNLVRLHDFLNFFSDIAKSNIDTCCFDSSIGSVFDCFEQIIIDWIESNSKCTISHKSFDV